MLMFCQPNTHNFQDNNQNVIKLINNKNKLASKKKENNKSLK